MPELRRVSGQGAIRVLERLGFAAPQHGRLTNCLKMIQGWAILVVTGAGILLLDKIET